MASKKDEPLTQKEAFLKAASYCAYQERCESEVHQKLLDLGLRGNELEEVLVWLREEKFLNEKRFAVHFAGGKFRVKQWGKMKIAQALMQKRVPDRLIHEALEDIDWDEYQDTLFKLLEKKRNSLGLEDEPFKLKKKLLNYASSKGYEPDVIWTIIREMDL